MGRFYTDWLQVFLTHILGFAFGSFVFSFCCFPLSLSKAVSGWGCFFLRQEAGKVCRLLRPCVIKPTNNAEAAIQCCKREICTRAEHFRKIPPPVPSAACDENEDEANRASGISGRKRSRPFHWVGISLSSPTHIPLPVSRCLNLLFHNEATVALTPAQR